MLWELVSAPEDVPTTLARLRAAGDEIPGQVERWIAGDAKASAEERISIYANMYFHRLKDALRADFPRTADALGEAPWQNLVTDFLLAHPSTKPSIRWVGEPLPEFLETWGGAPGERWLAGLARVEWAESDSWQAVDEEIRVAEQLAGVTLEEWPECRFAKAAHANLVDAGTDPRLLRLEVVDGLPLIGGTEGKPEPAPGERFFFLVYREGYGVTIERIESDEAAALGTVFAGGTFGEACEALAGGDDTGETDEEALAAAAVRAAGWLSGWISRGLFTSIG
jgi:hypothetical protein